MDNAFYKALELMISENVENTVFSLMVDHAFKLNVGRQGFGSVNPEIRIIEGRIIEVLLYYTFGPGKQRNNPPSHLQLKFFQMQVTYGDKN